MCIRDSAEAAGLATAVMCAESDPGRCHRSLIADAAALLHGAEVRHLLHEGRLAQHRPALTARVADGRLVYDVAAPRTLFDEPS